MPRTKKAPGTAVDRRNGRRTEVAASGSVRFTLPKRDPAWHPEVRRAVSALRADPVWQVVTPADRPVLLRWADAMDRAFRSFEVADASPVATGSMGQPVEHPLFMVGHRSLQVAAACERQLGVGARNRADLGLAVTEARRSLLELNRALMEGDDEPDPRRVPSETVVVSVDVER